MDFFDENENAKEHSSDEDSAQEQSSSEPKFYMPIGAIDSENMNNENLSEAIRLSNRKNHKSAKHRLAVFLLCIFMLCTGIGITIVTVRGHGFLSNLISGNQHMTFTLSTEDKPDVSESDKTADGKYTTEGLAKNLSSSVVSLEIFEKKSDIIPKTQGSGVIISENGYIVTNAHVVDNSDGGIKAVLSDGTEYQAKIVGSDIKSDLAVVKIPAKKLSPAKFGNSSQVNLGEEIMTIGSPGGYYGTVTKGIVSGLGRTTKFETGRITDCIQIDAAINPGNSGGALFNMWGQVIGITSSKLSASSYDGIGFAISSNYAKPIIEKIISGENVDGGARIGITFYTITTSSAQIRGTVAGLMVASIDETCDIAKTQLREGDIITKIDGKSVTEIEDVGSFISAKNPGDELTCHAYRKNENGTTKEFDIKFKLMQDDGGFTNADDSSYE